MVPRIKRKGLATINKNGQGQPTHKIETRTKPMYKEKDRRGGGKEMGGQTKASKLRGPTHSRKAWWVHAAARPAQVRRTRNATAARAVRNMPSPQATSVTSRRTARAHAALSRSCLHMLTGCCSMLPTVGCPHAAASLRSHAHPDTHTQQHPQNPLANAQVPRLLHRRAQHR